MNLELIRKRVAGSAEAILALEDIHEDIAAWANILDDAFNAGKQLYVCGNGGSAADSQHFVTELLTGLNRAEIGRVMFPAIDLTSSGPTLTSLGNDVGFDSVFSAQINALGCTGDVALCISTSGASRNVIEALIAAKRIGMTTVFLTGKGQEDLSYVDLHVRVPGENTQVIQEAMLVAEHIVCEYIVDNRFSSRGNNGTGA